MDKTLTVSILNVGEDSDQALLGFLGFDTRGAFYHYGRWADSQAEQHQLQPNSGFRTWLELEAPTLIDDLLGLSHGC